MKEEKRIILELGNCPFDALIITKIAREFLAAYGNDWTLQKTNQWEINICNNNRCDYHIIERDIKRELERLSQLYWDLETFGLINNEKEKEEI